VSDRPLTQRGQLEATIVWRAGKTMAYLSYVAGIAAFAVCYWGYDLGFWLSIGAAIIATVIGIVILFGSACVARW
jgi:hypothetical protein